MKKRLLLILPIFFATVLSSQVAFTEAKPIDIGIDHAYHDKFFFGGGAAFFDMDNDGDDDLYLTGGLDIDHLYQNNGDGTFTKLIAADVGLGVTDEYNTTGITTGDIDNDGDRDLFVTTWESFVLNDNITLRNLIFINDGSGVFTEVGEMAGITHAAFSMGAHFMDYNKDGFLDIYVANHVDEPDYFIDAAGNLVEFTYGCFPNFLYQNNGDGTFTEAAAALGVADEGCSTTAFSADHDQDGDTDIFVVNDLGKFLMPNQLYQNNFPDAAFGNTTTSSGAGMESFGLGIAAADYDHDLDLDVYQTNLGKNVLLENTNGSFTDVAGMAGVENEWTANPNGTFSASCGTAFFDADNDSWEDLCVVSGGMYSLFAYPTSIIDPDRFFLNNGDKTFTDVTDAVGINSINQSRGMAYSDFDQDGDVDMVVVSLNNLGDTTQFYVNESVNDNHYVQFRLTGTGESNRDAFGAKLWVYAGGQAYYKEYFGGGGSYLSQHSSVLHFGLGASAQVDSVRIQWPDGQIESLGSYTGDQLYNITQSMVTSSGSSRNLNKTGIQISPNPTSGLIHLSNTKAETVAIFDNMGGLVFNRVQPGSSIDISNFPAGFYFMKITLGGAVYSARVVKE